MTCALGIHFVGFVMMCSGAVDSLCSIIFGRLSRYTGRPALLSFGIVIYIASLLIVVFMTLLFQVLSPSETFPGVTHNINVCHYPCLMLMIFDIVKNWYWSCLSAGLSIGLASCQQYYNCNMFVLYSGCIHDFQLAWQLARHSTILCVLCDATPTFAT